MAYRWKCELCGESSSVGPHDPAECVAALRARTEKAERHVKEALAREDAVRAREQEQWERAEAAEARADAYNRQVGEETAKVIEALTELEATQKRGDRDRLERKLLEGERESLIGKLDAAERDLFAARQALLTEGRQRDALAEALRRIAEMSELGLDGSIYRDIHTAARAALAGVRHGG